MVEKFSGKRLLLLEDEPSLLRTYKDGLQELGFAVTPTTKLSEALEAISKWTFHLAWIDLTLDEESSDRDGYALVRELRKSGEGTKILIVTRHYDYTDALEATQRIGADDFLGKRDLPPREFMRCVPKLEALIDSCSVDKSSDLTTAMEGLFERGLRDIITGRVISKFPGQIDGRQLADTLLNVFNRVKPIKRKKAADSTIGWNEDDKGLHAEFWSKGLGCSIRVQIGDALAASFSVDKIVYEKKRNKGVAFLAIKTEEPRGTFLD